MTAADIVRYWRSVELLQPQTAPKFKKRDKPYQSFIHDTPVAKPVMPWDKASIVAKESLPAGKVWSHLLFAHCYDFKYAVKALEDVFGAEQGYKEPQSQVVALYALKLTHTGVMVADSLVLSTAAWLLARVRAGEDWTRSFDETQDKVRAVAAEHLSGVVTSDKIFRLTNWIITYFGLREFFAEQKTFHRFRSKPIKPTQVETDDDPLNSFILDDLADVADNLERGNSSAPLNAYVTPHTGSGRIDVSDVRSSRYLLDQLSPARYPSGCWPTEADLGLVHSQQLAVNNIVGGLSASKGQRAVNGPPGTGKTTLLRDIIASVVTGRADALASLPRAADAFEEKGVRAEQARDGGKPLFCFRLTERLLGHEIVVASSNNGAVENVTLELPQRDKIDERWLAELDYFGEFGTWLTGKPAWGLFSGALGNKTNRGAFVSRFYYGKGEPLGTTASETDELDEELDDLEVVPDTTGKADQGLGDGSQPTAGTDEHRKHKGFRGWLDEQEAVVENLKVSRKSLWEAAVKRYTDAKARAEAVGAEAALATQLVDALLQAREQARTQQEALAQSRAGRESLKSKVEAIIEEGTAAQGTVRTQATHIQRHIKTRPGFLANLFSLWGCYRQWKQELDLLQKVLLAEEKASTIVDLKAKQLRDQLTEFDRVLAASEAKLQQLQHAAIAREAQLTTLAEKYKAAHFLAWLRTGSIGRGPEIELAEPWIVPGWRQARARVFIEALRLHKTFFELEPKRVRANLNFVTSMLQGTRYRGVSQDAIRSAWATLFMVVPVLSSTFASFARTFSTLGAGEIGWLLVDEAGQATPQAAVGALWRSRRAVLVGDPLQLKPILSVSDAALEHMRQPFRVDPRWIPSGQSAQSVADQGSAVGKMLGPAGMKSWVGLPLVVHRRCDRPMFELANKIAYDGAMVYGTSTPSPEKETTATLPTGWIDVRGPSDGNWVEAEGKALKVLLARLAQEGVATKDISVITPFQDVRNQLQVMLRQPMVFGTIHTMQGKESSVVVLVLGGSSEKAGAREWAVSEPNLVNVAATRAKRRLYVIGDRADWSKRPIFCKVMHLLPELGIPTASTGTQAGGAPAKSSVP
ncbi:DEAD/DEAH box helicase [Pseudomonas veronii]|uniref:DEAD/DEAH box helicase n=1 Tax=Pseudomonas veronii TaxID=76761 RepID=UPI0021C1F447|nr:AAA domain-containing protein [Pseudomonas veronii]MCT9827402.1 AAA domain-containing protein [Pseudomonas veronii]